MKQLFLITAIFLSTLTMLADDKKDELVDGKFKISGVSGLNMSQTAQTNWSAGGENSVAGTAYLNGLALRKSGNWLWENNLVLEYGLTKTKSNGTRKVGDKIDFSTKMGYSTNGTWYYTAMADFKTQFDKGYKYSGTEKGQYISKFLAPAYSNVSLGMEYRKPWYSLYLSPVAGKLTFVQDDYLSSIGAFGVDPGDKFRAEIGAYFKARAERELVQNVKVISTLSFFTAYDKSFGNVDVDWDMLLSMKINKFMSATLNTTLKYDDDIRTPREDGSPRGPRIQFKEVLGVGFSYNF